MGRRLLIFDFDGTLADTFELFLDVFDETAAIHEFEAFDRGNLDHLRTLDAKSILQYHRVPTWKLPVITYTARQLMKRHIQSVRLFAGIEPAIASLHEGGAILALVTSNSRANVIGVLGHQVAAYFDYLECGVSIFGKHAKIRKLLTRGDFALDNTMLIGDEVRDAHAARRTGVSFGAVSWGYTAIETLLETGAQEYFFSPSEIPAKLMR
jgi:phosphoglycolate phosphatase